MFRIRKGLDLPISGVPEQHVTTGASIHHVAIVGDDYVGMRPAMLVQEGDRVIKGQALFEDKKNPGVMFTAPASGTVVAIHRGERRVLQSVVIQIEGDEKREFARFDAADLATLSHDVVQTQLLESGLWTALRTRPYSKTPVPGTVPAAIFVTAIDTNPLSADPQPLILAERKAF
ncbi:TPA: NADH:ubiquinone reductase (Na(+)-transporting) subunit A, partial [Enterobacter hormaechei]|nr:NADH:ubiquinone reductase (Na(+)-transporting) subunit A [Enterobacter hormaechei]